MPEYRTNRTLSARTPKQRCDWQPGFLEALEKGHTVAGACKAAKVGRTTAYEARRRDEKFARAWQDLEEQAIEVLEAEAYRRAIDGSDKLMEFLLKARRPEVYRDRTNARDGYDDVEMRERVRRELDARKRARRMPTEERERYLLGAGIIDGRESEREAAKSRATASASSRNSEFGGALGD
jgi:hypothetical protein